MSAQPQPAATNQPGPQPTTRPRQAIQVPMRACGCLLSDVCECWDFVPHTPRSAR